MFKKFVSVFVLILFPGSVFSSEECVVHAPHEFASYVIVDRTEKLQDTSNLKSFLSGVRESMSQGERVVIAISSDTTANTKILLDLVNPKESVWESTMKIRAAQNKIKRCFLEVEKHLSEDQQETKHSAILETIGYFSKLVTQDSGTGKKRLFIFSDMVQNSKALSFWSQKIIDPVASIKSAQKLELVPQLAGVEVIVAGAGNGVDDQKAKSIEKFWQSLFELAGAKVASYGPLLDLH